MKYFERSNKFANILFAVSVVFFIALCILVANVSVIDQIFQYSNGNYVRAGILFIFFFTAFLFSTIMGTALKCIVRDAKQELDAINDKGKNKEHESDKQ